MKNFITTVFLCFSLSAMAQNTGLMYGTPLPDPFAAGPTVQSKHADIKAVTDEKFLLLELPINEPEGAILAVLSEHKAKVFLENQDKPLPTLNEQGLGLNDVIPGPMAVFAQLDTLEKGRHQLSVKPLTTPKVTLRFVEKQSPLTLFAKTKPLAVTQNQKFTLNVWFDDEEPIHFANVSVQDPKGRRYMLQKNANGIYQASLNGPDVKGRKLVYYTIKAEGDRFDGSQFLRTASVGLMAIEAQSGFAKPPKATLTDIDFMIKEAQGNYRLELIYGHKGKSIAWQRHKFFMDGEKMQLQIKRPESTMAADAVVIKLLNMDSLGLEGVVETKLPYDKILYNRYEYTSAPSTALPTVKKQALEKK